MIDRDRVMILYRRGKTLAEIAREMGCSRKQAGRIVRARRTELDRVLHRAARRGDEEGVWLAMALCRFTLNEIARQVGLTAQAIQEAIEPHLATIDQNERVFYETKRG